jgi:hypothetical protein
MSDIHDLILLHGHAGARELVSPNDRHLVDAAAAVLAVQKEEIGISYSGFALTSLPHKRIPDDQVWKRTSHRLTLMVTPGWLPGTDGDPVPVGVPYGIYARLIMLYMQTQAIKTGSRKVELGRSMGMFMERLGLSNGGETYSRVWDQAKRIAACNLVFSWQRGDGRADFVKDTFVTKGAFHVDLLDPSQSLRRMWEDEVTLGEHFYKQLLAHPVPILEQALRQLSRHSVAIDVYIWLAYRLHSLPENDAILARWSSLAAQFGAGYNRIRDFKRFFQTPLRLALAVYPEAKVEIVEEGLMLRRSRPPVAKLVE